ncbi:MAG: hypothetical protein LCH84_13855 [Gemmatimonadetes bacterium]|nr:hypothetical protein [Gemmatimonadota bacterium]
MAPLPASIRRPRTTRRVLTFLIAASSLSVSRATSAAAQRAESQRAASQRADSLSSAQFAALSARLSDAGGYFDTDNLISNEASLLHPLPTLTRRGVQGGVYIGVGPDQNFNYIARVQPRLAIIADIRRDNLLHHLLFKALFESARNRAEFLALWTGRPVPADVDAWSTRSVDSLVAWAARTRTTDASIAAARRAVRARVAASGFTLSAQDLATIDRFHGAFIAEGVRLRFTSTGRPPQWYYPTLGQLLAERDTDGVQSGWMASEAAFRVVQSLEQRNLVVPVVGDLSGAVLPKVAALLRERGDSVSVLYTSNVEDYLIRDGRFPSFVRGVRALPRTANSVLIRSWFGGEGSHPLNVRGYHVTQLTESLGGFATDATVERAWRYSDVVSRLR